MHLIRRLLIGLIMPIVCVSVIAIPYLEWRLSDDKIQSHSTVNSGEENAHKKLCRLNSVQRGPSIRSFLELRVGTVSLIEHARENTVWVIDGADDFDLIPDADSNRHRFGGLLNGELLTTEIGTGVPLAADGYVLTAAHCVTTGRALVLSSKNGSPVQAARGSVIWNGLHENPPLDCMILRVPGLHFDGADPLTTKFQVETGTSIPGASILCSGSGASGLCVAGGKLVNLDARTQIAVIEAPLLPGDSGGPVFLGDGRLMGIMTTASIDGNKTSGAVLCPKWDVLLMKVKEDRLGHHSDSAAKSHLSPAGTIRMMQLDEDLRVAVSASASDNADFPSEQ